MADFSSMTLEELIRKGGYDCACGRHHGTQLKYVKIGRGVVKHVPDAMRAIGITRPFIVCDVHTRAAAWDAVKAALDQEKIPYSLYCFTHEQVEPDERAVGALCMAFDPACDGVIAVGSGVVNDCCKVLAHAVSRPQMVVGTAPSMDGYASNSSSMIQNRVKVTLYNACPGAILADTDIMSAAPERMLWAGLGDMLAKYIALCEWRISHAVNGEYYCEQVAGLMRRSLQKVVSAAPRLTERDPEVIGAIAEGLILSGIAMAFAQVSRPASGLEHYFSHVWEMLALERGEAADLHGIQVGVGTYLCMRIYDRLRTMTPDRRLAQAARARFDETAWEQRLRRVLGSTAGTLVSSERNAWHKNEAEGWKRRFDAIERHWDEIVRVMDEELPDTQEIIALMESVGMPVHPADIGQSERDTYDAFYVSRDVRDKYLTSSLLWDMGLLDTFPLDL